MILVCLLGIGLVIQSGNKEEVPEQFFADLINTSETCSSKPAKVIAFRRGCEVGFRSATILCSNGSQSMLTYQDCTDRTKIELAAGEHCAALTCPDAEPTDESEYTEPVQSEPIDSFSNPDPETGSGVNSEIEDQSESAEEDYSDSMFDESGMF